MAAPPALGQGPGKAEPPGCPARNAAAAARRRPVARGPQCQAQKGGRSPAPLPSSRGTPQQAGEEARSARRAGAAAAP
eukprot:6727660-Alexandrium_andersonii.AAC.1